MELEEQLSLVKTRSDLADFIDALRKDLVNNKNNWENQNLDMYFEAMSSWIRSDNVSEISANQELPNKSQ